MPNRIFLIIALVFTGLAFSLFACSNSANETVTPGIPPPTSTPTIFPTPLPTSTPNINQGTVSIWHSLGDQDIQTLVQIIADFQDKYPDTKFDVLYLPENILLERYRQAVLDGTGPAILLGPASWAPTLVEEDLVLDLIEMVSSEIKERLNPAGLEAGKVNSFQAGLPYTLDGVVLYRNRNLIPNPSDTWEDLVEQAQSASQEDRVGAFLDRGFYFSGAHLLGLGGEIMNPDGTPAFNTEKGDEWLNLLISFDEAGPTDFLTTQDSERFGQGLVGYIFDTAANREKLADLIGSQNLAIDSWPFYGEGRLSGFLIPQLFFINNHAHQDSTRLASLFGTYLLSPEAQSKLAANGLIPAVIDAPVEDPLIIQAIQALRGNSPYPTISSIDLYRNALDTAINAVTSGSATPAEALQAAEAVILAALANSQITPTP